MECWQTIARKLEVFGKTESWLCPFDTTATPLCRLYGPSQFCMFHIVAHAWNYGQKKFFLERMKLWLASLHISSGLHQSCDAYQIYCRGYPPTSHTFMQCIALANWFTRKEKNFPFGSDRTSCPKYILHNLKETNLEKNIHPEHLSLCDRFNTTLVEAEGREFWWQTGAFLLKHSSREIWGFCTGTRGFQSSNFPSQVSRVFLVHSTQGFEPDNFHKYHSVTWNIHKQNYCNQSVSLSWTLH